MKQKQNTDKHLTANDIKCAEMTWIKSVQQTYTKEMQQLHGFKVKTSLVKQLQLFIDEDGLVRVNGQLNNAPLDYNTKFPILLPRNTEFTNLIIRNAHENVMDHYCLLFISMIFLMYQINSNLSIMQMTRHYLAH